MSATATALIGSKNSDALKGTFRADNNFVSSVPMLPVAPGIRIVGVDDFCMKANRDEHGDCPVPIAGLLLIS